MDLGGALPESFPFYHLGQVNKQTDAQSPFDFADMISAAFSFASRDNKVRGWFVVVFDKGLDASLYSEMGNVLASRFADRIAVDAGPVSISPPRSFDEEQLKRLFTSSEPTVFSNYVHSNGSIAVPIRTAVFLSDVDSKEAAAWA